MNKKYNVDPPTRTCDRCGAVYVYKDIVTGEDIGGVVVANYKELYDLCPCCFSEFNELMKEHV